MCVLALHFVEYKQQCNELINARATIAIKQPLSTQFRKQTVGAARTAENECRTNTSVLMIIDVLEPSNIRTSPVL